MTSESAEQRSSAGLDLSTDDRRVSEAKAATPEVTVVIPVYNLEDYLPQTIESVLQQDYVEPVHVLILDDGSTDNSLQVARQLACSNPSLQVHSQQNQGRAITRNNLLQLATTELIAWIDGDDIAAPCWLREQVTFLRQNAECAAVSAHGYAMTAAHRPIGPIFHPLSASEIERRHLEGDASVFFQSCVTVRKAAVLAAGAYDPRYHCAEDYSLWLRLSDQGTLNNLDRFHLYYRVHGTSANWTVSKEQRTQGAEILKAARQRKGLPPKADVERPPQLPPPQLDDWHRRIYWINIALQNGNPATAISMAAVALQRHPLSLVLWLMLAAAVGDTVLFFGNRTDTPMPGQNLNPGQLPQVSFYRLGRWLNGCRRRLRANCLGAR